MKKKHIFSGAAIVALSIFAAGCSSDDTTLAYEDNNTLTTFTGGSEATNTEADSTAATRTSVYTNPRGTTDLTVPFTFYWEPGDYVFVKEDDNSTWRKSANGAANWGTSADFNLYGTFLKSQTYTVHYTGKNSNSATEVTIKNVQGVDNNSASTKYIGLNGDCASGTATKQSQGKYKFTVTHKASYLRCAFYSSNATTYNAYKIKEINVTSNQNIAGTYDFSDGKLTGKQPKSNPSKTIKFDYSSEVDASRLNIPSAPNGIFHCIIIAPGTHTLTVEFVLVDKNGGTATKTVKKIYKSKTFNENTIYTINPDLK